MSSWALFVAYSAVCLISGCVCLMCPCCCNQLIHAVKSPAAKTSIQLTSIFPDYVLKSLTTRLPMIHDMLKEAISGPLHTHA